MATLEKIRSKSVFLLVVIGVALLAFIIGDFFTSGRTLFGTGTTIAKVGNQKIDIQEFQRRVEQANQQAQNSGQKIDQAVLQQQVLNSLVNEKLFKQELEDLELVVTDSELSDAMLGSGSAYVDRMVQSQTGIESAATLHDMAFNPVKYGLDQSQAAQLQGFWMMLETQVEQSLLQQKFQNLFGGTLVANQLDAKALYDENASTAHVAYVQKPFSALSNDNYVVTEDEVRKEWEKNKEMYRLPEEVRSISYINIDIAPSPEDVVAAEQRVESAIAALREKEGVEGVADMTDFVVNRQKSALGSIRDNQLKRFADTASVGEAALVSRVGNDFVLAKMIGRSNEVDSINLDYIAVAGDAAMLDSLVNALNNGASVAELKNNPNVQNAQDSMWVSAIDPQMSALKDVLLSQNTGVYFTPDTAATQGGRIFRVNRRKAPVSVVDYALIDFTAEPSNATVNQLQSKLQAYLNANKTAKEFVENAAEAGFNAFPTQVSASTPEINRIPETRNTISWAMNAKKGEVSPLFGDETSGHFMAAAVTNIYDDYTPATDAQLKAMLTNKLINDKKAADLIGQYQGKANDLAGYASLMDSKIDSTYINFGVLTPYNPGVAGADITAKASLAKAGELVGPAQGASGVMVLQVINVDDQGRPYNFDESANNYLRTRGAGFLGNQMELILLGNKNVKNNILKFYRD